GAHCRGRTCVLATHEFEAGLRISDRVVVLDFGRVVADSPLDGLDARGLEDLFRRATRADAAGLPP
ncbi:MAG: hypothetical protein ACE5JG_10925, partial [Planctomycetota bacterium]